MADYPTVLLFDGPTRLGTLRVDNPTTVGHVLKVASTSPLSVEWGAGGGGGGGGDVVGPSSSVDGRVSVFDGTTGKLIKQVPVGIDSSGNVSGVGTLTLGTALTVGNGGTGSTSAAGARTNLGLVIGTDVQAYSPNYVTASSAFTADNSIVRAAGTGRGTQTSLVDVNDSGAVVPRTGSTQQLGNASLPWVEVWALQLTMPEQAAAQAPSGGWAGRSAFWGRSDTPTVPMFTDDAGTSRRLAYSGANSDITSLSGLTTALSVAQGGIGADLAAFSGVSGVEHDLMIAALAIGSVTPVGTGLNFNNGGFFAGAASVGTAQVFTGTTMASLRPHAQWRGTVTTGAAVGLTLASAVANETFPCDRLDDYYFEGGFAVSNVAQVRAGGGWVGTAATFYAARTSTALGARIVNDGGTFYGVVGDGTTNNNVAFSTAPVADTFYKFSITMVSGTTTFVLRDKAGNVVETRTVPATPLAISGFMSAGHQALALSAGTYYMYPGRFVVCRLV